MDFTVTGIAGFLEWFVPWISNSAQNWQKKFEVLRESKRKAVSIQLSACELLNIKAEFFKFFGSGFVRLNLSAL
jgi:hypothetical protein